VIVFVDLLLGYCTSADLLSLLCPHTSRNLGYITCLLKMWTSKEQFENSSLTKKENKILQYLHYFLTDAIYKTREKENLYKYNPTNNYILYVDNGDS